VETFRAVDRARLAGSLNDPETAAKRKELTDLLRLIDLAPVDERVIEKAKGPFAVSLAPSMRSTQRPQNCWPRKQEESRWNSGPMTIAKRQRHSHAA
jgi:hypothetical protein